MNMLFVNAHYLQILRFQKVLLKLVILLLEDIHHFQILLFQIVLQKQHKIICISRRCCCNRRIRRKGIHRSPYPQPALQPRLQNQASLHWWRHPGVSWQRTRDSQEERWVVWAAAYDTELHWDVWIFSATKTKETFTFDIGAQKVGATKVAVWHNADDVAETVLFNVLRGDLNRYARSVDIKTDACIPPRIKPFAFQNQRLAILCSWVHVCCTSLQAISQWMPSWETTEGPSSYETFHRRCNYVSSLRETR